MMAPLLSDSDILILRQALQEEQATPVTAAGLQACESLEERGWLASFYVPGRRGHLLSFQLTECGKLACYVLFPGTSD